MLTRFLLIGLLQKSSVPALAGEAVTTPTNMDSDEKHLYISLVRSQLLYFSQLWRPQLIKDIQNVERIQYRATKFIAINQEDDKHASPWLDSTE